jgi:thiamine monophosphate kinase
MATRASCALVIRNVPARISNKASAIIQLMKVSELGEFGLINLIRSSIARYEDSERAPWPEVLVGIGDDAAAWRSDNNIQLATTDTLVQDIHFDLGIISWQELGWKALAVNLSDIAAMGGMPQYALLSLALPGKWRWKTYLNLSTPWCISPRNSEWP